ncbi:MAG TPA: nucleotidyltransferase domain-containing protein [Archaeoglobaceae archaeon]|nr:nucleotidyltransferase domain-containing protein [Archaeoglobaceae archaeon]
MQKKLPEDLIERIQKLISALGKKGVKIEHAYLFGSYARNDYLKTSDIDVILVSDSWKDLPMLKRMDIVNKVLWRENMEKIEVIPVTSRELNEKKSVVLRDASRYWIKIA